jgi:hypothetical protein
VAECRASQNAENIDIDISLFSPHFFPPSFFTVTSGQSGWRAEIWKAWTFLTLKRLDEIQHLRELAHELAHAACHVAG